MTAPAKSKVYFIQDDAGWIKIGHSTDPVARIMSLQSAHAGRLSFLRVIDGGPNTERWLHNRFAERRVRGEWFEFDHEMLTVVPPDEIPQVPVIKPRLRKTLREAVLEADQFALFGEGQERLLAMSLFASFWDDDIDAFLIWVRERVGVPAPSRDDEEVAA